MKDMPIIGRITLFIMISLVAAHLVLRTQVSCRSLGLAPATTQLATPQERLKAAQQDLDDGLRIVNDVRDITGTKQLKFVDTAYPLAQDAINLAGVAIDTKQPNALDLLDKAAQAARDYRKLASKKP